MKDDAEILRKKYLYKRLIRNGKLKVSFKTAKKFVGPDTAYHLYSAKLNKKLKD